MYPRVGETASRLHRLLFVVCSSILAATASGARAQLMAAADVTISLITFGRRDQVHQYFGHNALVVDGAGLVAPTVFNYGMFTCGPDMVPNFLRGRLRFGSAPPTSTAPWRCTRRTTAT